MGTCESEKYKPKPTSNLKDRAPESFTKVDMLGMSKPGNNKIRPELEVFTGYKHITKEIENKTFKSLCKVIVTTNKGIRNENGFFLNVDDVKKYLVTRFHLEIDEKIINIVLEIYNHKKIQLNMINRDIQYLPKPKNTALIEIKITDDIYNDIEFLYYDVNYILNGYEIYDNIDIYSIENPITEYAKCKGGRIISVNGYEFTHDITMSGNSTGLPVLSLNDNIETIQVIGIYEDVNQSTNINSGAFLGEVINNINNYNNLNNCNNYITADIYIKYEDIQKEMNLIGSYEEYCREHNYEMKEDQKNEKEIKKCRFIINDKFLPFRYSYRFKKVGDYTVKYIFTNYLTDTNHMFYNCQALINMDFTYFNTQNVTNMNSMFYGCEYLQSIKLSNFNTHNVTDMSWMFSHCSSIPYIYLSSFDTLNVTNMNGMFSDCKSLKKIDLSGFNSQNVTNMSYMFYNCASIRDIHLYHFNTQNVTEMKCMFSGCSILTLIDLSSFNTQNVTNMWGMFSYCKYLQKIDLSNFNTKKVTNMNHMFYNCESLYMINLCNFDSQNTTDINYMFYGCKSLRRKENIITKDNRIFQNIWNVLNI